MSLSKVIGAGFLFFLSMAARGQFYAPETEYHDPIQRMYVVELARVLAWYENQKHPGIEQVKYQITTKADRTTVWELQWLEKDSKARLQAKIEYPGSLLDGGVEFYRKIGSDLTHQDWQRRFKATKKGDAIDGFWKGAAEMGVSREESIGKAFAVAANVAEDPGDAIPELAGILTHTGILSVTDRMTIDSVVVARAAAWLYIAERSTAENLDSLWAPILFLGGRERQAVQLWQKSYPAEIPKATSQQAGWNIWLRGPTSREVYQFATEPANLAMGMPMMASDSSANDTHALFVEAVFLGVPRKEWVRLHNFGPRLERSGVSGGRLMEGYFPFFQRASFVQLMANLKPDTSDFTDYTNQLGMAQKYEAPKRLKQEDEASLLALKESAPLFKLGRKEGVGPLAPTAVATSRDLLNYGWEMTGSQMGGRYRFVQYSWGIPELGKLIFKESTRLVDGMMPFFENESTAKTYNYRETQLRLQLVDGLKDSVGWSANPFTTEATENATQLFVKRAWLRPQELDWQLRSLWDKQDFKGIESLLTSYSEEGGAVAAARAITYLDAIVSDHDSLKAFPAARRLAKAFAPKVAQATRSYVRAIGMQDLENFERAVKYEELYWKNPDSGLEPFIIRNYLFSGAFKSARRFYEQSRQNFGDSILIANGVALDVLPAGLLRKDDQLCQWVLEDSASGSHSDMILHVWNAAFHDDLKEVKSVLGDMIERYEPDQPDALAHKLLGFLPLLPALKDPKHAQHQAALSYFGQQDIWMIPRWLWVDKFNLSKEDAIEFLGGRESDVLRRALVCYLEKDRVGMLDAINKYNAATSQSGGRRTLLYFLYEQISDHKFHGEDKDLKPKDSESVRTWLRRKFAGNTR